MTSPVPRASGMACAIAGSRRVRLAAIERCRLAHDPQPPGTHCR
ncbi:hypothetical protein ACWGCW_16725 [Streptomyces sp. NPDC054933]